MQLPGVEVSQRTQPSDCQTDCTQTSRSLHLQVKLRVGPQQMCALISFKGTKEEGAQPQSVQREILLSYSQQ